MKYLSKNSVTRAYWEEGCRSWHTTIFPKGEPPFVVPTIREIRIRELKTPQAYLQIDICKDADDDSNGGDAKAGQCFECHDG